jgi:hypothetical protein
MMTALRVAKDTQSANRLRCWPWPGRHRRPSGGTGESGVPGDYAVIGTGAHARPAHCVIYEAQFGRKIPKGMHAHHTCENTWCINPWHVEVLTNAEHQDRHRKKPRTNRRRKENVRSP